MKRLIILAVFLNFALESMAQSCIDATPPGVALPPANTKTFWNWKGDDATKFDGTGNFFFRQEFGTNIGLVTQYSPFSAGHNQPNTSQFTIPSSVRRVAKRSLDRRDIKDLRHGSTADIIFTPHLSLKP